MENHKVSNERLRQAIYQAGLDPATLADHVGVDEKTVYRWLAGRTPRPRHRAKIARALGREQPELWPEIATAPVYDDHDARSEIHGAWATPDDDQVPDLRELIEEAHDQIDLCDYSLLETLADPDTTGSLAAKAAAGCQVRILIAASDSIWVTARAEQLGQSADYIGQSELHRQIDTARGHLEPLLRTPGIQARQFYTHPGYRILRADTEMLITAHLQAAPTNQAPVLHLRRRQDGGLFDQFAAHLNTIAVQSSEPLDPAPDLYPDPRTDPQRYQPVTAHSYQQELEAGRDAYQRRQPGVERPIEQVRGELRRPEAQTDAAP